MRKYRTMPFRDLINLALNETLSRTILTVSTIALAVLSLLFLGGEVLRGFSIAMLWGIVIGTYSSLFIAAPMLYYIRPNRAAIARSEPRRPHGAGAARRRGIDADGAAMELIPLVPAGRQVIERYAASGFRVSGVIHHGPVLVFPDRTVAVGGAGVYVRKAWRRSSSMAASRCCCSASGGAWRRCGARCAPRWKPPGSRSSRWTPARPAAPITCWSAEDRRVAAALLPPV